jgi:hypothetical protein
MQYRVEKVESPNERRPYEAPRLIRHGSVEQLTAGFVTTPSGLRGDS